MAGAGGPAGRLRRVRAAGGRPGHSRRGLGPAGLHQARGRVSLEAHRGRRDRQGRHEDLRRRGGDLHRSRSDVRPGQRHPDDPDTAHLGRHARVQHEDQARRLPQRVGQRPAAAGERTPGREERLRHPGAGSPLLRRDPREDRRAEVPHHERGLHHVRAAETAVGDHLRHGGAQHRPLCDAAELADAGEGGAGPLPADHLLPDQQGGPGDGLPAADVHGVDAQGEHDQQRVLLGHQPQPGRDVQLRLVLENGPRVRHRVPVRAHAVVVGRRALLHAERAGRHRRRRQRPDRRRAGAAQLRRSGKPGRGPAVQAPGPAAPGLLLGHHRPADLQHQHLRRVAAPAELLRQRERQLGPVQRRRLARPEPVLLQRG